MVVDEAWIFEAQVRFLPPRPYFLQKEQRHGGPKGVGTLKADKRLGYNSIRTDKFYSVKSKQGART